MAPTLSTARGLCNVVPHSEKESSSLTLCGIKFMDSHTDNVSYSMLAHVPRVLSNPNTHTDTVKFHMDAMCRNYQINIQRIRIIWYNRRSYWRKESQSTFLPKHLNRNKFQRVEYKCSLDSPLLDTNWNRKSRRTVGLGRRNPTERLPTEARHIGRGFRNHIKGKHFFRTPSSRQKEFISGQGGGSKRE